MNLKEHLLTVLGEEGCEIAQAVSKINRFGLHDTNILNPTGPDNQQRLVSELNDLMGTVRLLVIEGVIPVEWQNIEEQENKMRKILKFVDYAKEHGAIR